MTPRGLKGKGRAMTAMDLVGATSAMPLSRALSLPAAAPQTQTPPISPPPLPDFTFAPLFTSTQQQQQHGGDALFGLVHRGNGVLGRVRDFDVDGAGWARDVPVVEAEGDVDADVVGVDVGVGVSVGVGEDKDEDEGEEKGACRREGEKGLGPGLLRQGIADFGRDG